MLVVPGLDLVISSFVVVVLILRFCFRFVLIFVFAGCDLWYFESVFCAFVVLMFLALCC